MLSSVFNNNVASIDVKMVLIVSLVSIILGVIIALTHKISGTYNKNYLVTISLLPLLVQSVILLVNGNLGMGLIVAGTFGLVRFRSVPGTSKEILSVFFSMTVGLCTGMGYIIYAGMLTIVGSIVIIILSILPIYDRNKYERHLRITIPEDLDYSEVFDSILHKYTKSFELLSVKTTALGSMFELKYSVILKKDTKSKELIDEIRIKNGNLKITLSHPVEGSEIL